MGGSRKETRKKVKGVDQSDNWAVNDALLKMGRYYNTPLCHYSDMSVK